MSPVQLRHLSLPGTVPLIVSSDPQLLKAWESINAWFQKAIDTNWEPEIFLYHACLIMMTWRFMNLRANKMGKEGLATRLAAGTVIKKMQDVSGELKSLHAVTEWLGKKAHYRRRLMSVPYSSMLYINRSISTEQANLYRKRFYSRSKRSGI